LLETKYGISNFEYHLVGAGAYESIVRKEVQQTGLMNRVFFHGYIPHYDNRLQEFYRNADIFILPSMTLNDYDKEGIPGTIVEAMANGLPVISTYHAGIPSIIRHSEEGLLIRERDVEAMAEAIFQLATHPELRERLGKKGQEKAKNDLDLRVGTGRLEMIYDETLQQSVVVR
jgi:colanic acid/amylovoran biosynthesis glycosyltransferase